jgi:pyruvyltransferase
MLASRIAPTGYWWRGRPNFGDLLTPLLLSHFSDLQVVWAPIEEASFVCVGSVLDQLPRGWTGTVIGSGKLRPESKIDLSAAKVLALRGPLTAKGVRGVRGDFVIGDVGLLADELVTVEKKHALGIVPHWSDTQLEHRPEFKRFDPVIIRPSEDPLEVVRKIGECRKIVASSLHGIIVADAFGIPRRIEMTERFAKEGGDFKFRDHCAAVGLPFLVGVTQEPPRSKVQDRQHELYDVLTSFGREFMGYEP